MVRYGLHRQPGSALTYPSGPALRSYTTDGQARSTGRGNCSNSHWSQRIVYLKCIDISVRSRIRYPGICLKEAHSGFAKLFSHRHGSPSSQLPVPSRRDSVLAGILGLQISDMQTRGAVQEADVRDVQSSDSCREMYYQRSIRHVYGAGHLPLRFPLHSGFSVPLVMLTCGR